MLYIRVDANEKIGLGHVVRCLAIGEQAIKMGLGCTFIVSDQESQRIVNGFGYKAISLNSKWNNLEAEIDQLIEVISDINIRILLIDSYYITKEYLEIIGSSTILIYLGDLDFYVNNLDCVINYNVYYNEFKYDILFKNQPTKLLLGTKYFPIRSEFSNVKPKVLQKPTNLLLTAGGNDLYNLTGKILNYFTNKRSDENFFFNIVVSNFSKNLNTLKAIESKYDNIKVHVDTKNMAQLMNASDIAISAGGTTLYELCACGVPTICYAFVDNQLSSINEFMNSGTMISVGDIRGRESVCIELMYNEVLSLENNFSVRKKMSNRMKKEVDCMGSGRIVKEIINLYNKMRTFKGNFNE